jgi:hypothetical protein
MKKFIIIFLFTLFFISCGTKSVINEKPKVDANDVVRIANDELEYEIIIFEPGFNAWLQSTARPRNYYEQTYLENRNRIWVVNYNQRVLDPRRYDPLLYEMQINYQSNIDYGYEVNYLLFNYFVYFQQKYKQRLGGFEPRI